MKLHLGRSFAFLSLLFAAFFSLPSLTARALPSLTIPNITVTAGPSGTQLALFPVALSTASTSTVTFSYVSANGTATAGTDYTSTSGTLTISPGSLTGTIKVPVAGGQTDASGLTFTENISNAVNATISEDTGTATIIHDAAPIVVSVTPLSLKSPANVPELVTATYSSVAGAPNIATASLNLGKLSSPGTSLYAKYLSATGLVYLANSSGAYIGGYAIGTANTIATSLGTLNLAQSTVTQNGNNLVIGWDFTPTTSLVGAQNVYLDATDSFGLTSGFQNLAAWNIVAPPSAAIGNTSVLAGSTGTQHAVFPVTLSTAPLVPVTFGYSTANGTATAGTDYTATTGTLTIPAGSTTGTISVPVAGGQTDASGLTFTVTLSNPVNATIATATGTATITHDAAPVAVSVAPTTLTSPAFAPELLTTTYSSVGGAGNISTASLNLGKLSSPGTSLYAKYVASSGLFFLANSSGTYIGGYAAGTANTITTTLGTLNLASTTVTENGNNLVIGWDFIPTTSLIGAQNVYLDGTDSFGLSSGFQNLGAWTITAPPAAAINNVAVLAGPSGTQHAVFTVTLTSAPLVPVTLGYATANGTGTAGTDYSATSGTLTVPAGSTTGTISVPVAGGQTDASGLNFTVTLSNPVNATIATATGTATINHDTAPVAVSVTPNPAESPVNVPELLTATYSSVGGAANLASAGVNIGKLSSPGTSIYAKFVVSSGLFYVANASGTYVGGYAAGSANTITTTLGTLNLAATTVAASGNSLVIGWDFTPTSSLLGAQSVYLLASDNFGLTSGWQNLGAWTITASPANDNFANNQPIAGASGSITDTTAGATLQTGEPNPYGTANTVWYSYTGPASGTGVGVFTENNPNLLIVAYTGTALSNLVYITGGGTSVQFATTPGTVYYLQVQSTLANAGIFTLSWQWNQSPANDNFASAQALTGTSGSVNGTTVGATIQAGEPNPGSSVWYTWAAPTGSLGQVTFVPTSTGDEISLAAYTGTSLTGLTTVASGSNGANLVFSPAAGATYYIQAENYYTAQIPFTLNWTWLAFPPNDNFANAQVLTGLSGSVNGTTVGATSQAGEPNPGSTVWYEWGAPAGLLGRVTFVPLGASDTMSLAAFTGTSVSSLTPVTSGANNASITFQPTAGATYYIQAENYYSTQTAFTLNWDWVPANDDFANAQAISGATGTVQGTTVDATSETNEPYLSGTNTVWYLYTAPSSAAGSVTFSVVGFNGSPITNVYTGTALASLSRIGSGGSGLTVSTTAGANYYLQVQAAGSVASSFLLNWNWSASGVPANDDFANAQGISGASGSVVGTTIGATTQTGEPGLVGTSSVWCLYTPPASGPGEATFTVTGYENNGSYIEVYSGSSLTGLTAINGEYGVTATLAVSPADTYYIQVQSQESDTSNFSLNWEFTPAAANDNFANAQAISGASGSVNGTNVGASTQTGEPNLIGANTSTVWYLYTAPSSSAGQVTFTVTNYNANNCYLSTYTGTSLNALTTVTSVYGVTTSFAATPGSQYYLQVQSQGLVTSAFTLGWAFVPAASNDDFASAQAISGATGSVNGTTVGASVETGEPDLVGKSSVWYAYTAPATGSVTFAVTNYSGSYYTEAYSGTTLTALTPLNGGYSVGATFAVTAGTVYYIQVQSQGISTSVFTLGWTFTASSAYHPGGSATLDAFPVTKVSGHTA